MGQHGEDVGLVLGPVGSPQETTNPGTSRHPGVVAGGQRVEPETSGPVEKRSELDVAVALDAWVRGPPGGVVLDPFCGSGSTLIAAQELGRRFIGIELDEQHHRTASNRLQHREVAA